MAIKRSSVSIALMAVVGILVLASCGQAPNTRQAGAGELPEAQTPPTEPPGEFPTQVPTTPEAADQAARGVAPGRVDQSLGCTRQTLGYVRELERADWQKLQEQFKETERRTGIPGPSGVYDPRKDHLPDETRVWVCVLKGEFGDEPPAGGEFVSIPYMRVVLPAESGKGPSPYATSHKAEPAS